MWTCKNCHEEVEDSFEVCWKCGSTWDGVRDETFRREQDAGEVAARPDVDHAIAQRFRCAKCGGRESTVERLAMTNNGAGRLLNVQNRTFLAICCQKCGFTEFYNDRTWGGSSNLLSILDLLFG